MESGVSSTNVPAVVDDQQIDRRNTIEMWAGL